MKLRRLFGVSLREIVLLTDVLAEVVQFEMPILDCTNITLTPPVWLSNQMT